MDIIFYSGGSTTKIIRVNGNYTTGAQYTITPYRFDILSDQYLTTMTVNKPMAIFDIDGFRNRTDNNGLSLTKLKDISPLSGFSAVYEQSTKQTVITIPGVTENPVFIHFTQN